MNSLLFLEIKSHEVRAIATQAAEELGLAGFDVLFSTAEYKKESMRYFTEGCDGHGPT